MPCWILPPMTDGTFRGVAPDPGCASTLAFAYQEAADDARSSFVPHAHELTSAGFVGEGIRAARGRMASRTGSLPLISQSSWFVRGVATSVRRGCCCRTSALICTGSADRWWVSGPETIMAFCGSAWHRSGRCLLPFRDRRDACRVHLPQARHPYPHRVGACAFCSAVPRTRAPDPLTAPLLAGKPAAGRGDNNGSRLSEAIWQVIGSGLGGCSSLPRRSQLTSSVAIVTASCRSSHRRPTKTSD
jgi:hypothetical protein